MIANRPSRRDSALLFFETAALLGLGWGLSQWPHLASYVSTNQAPRGVRLAGAILPWAGALVSLLAAHILVRQEPGLLHPLRLWLERLRPLLVVWALPWLAARPAFAERPVALLLLTAIVVFGLEWTLRRAKRRGDPEPAPRRWPSWLMHQRWPRLLAASMILVAGLFLYFGSVRIHDKMLSSNYDFGLFENLFWNTLHGNHGIALNRRYFVEHAEFLLYALLPVYAAWPRSETLFALQALLMAGAAVPLYLVAERWLSNAWAAAALAFCYLCHPTIHGPAFYDFHFLPLSAFFVLWAAYFFTTKPGGVAFWLALVLGMACREDVALGVATVGAGLWWYGRQRRIALGMFALGALWFVLVKFVWMRRYGAASFTGYYSELIPRDEKGFGAVLTTLLSNPLYSMSRLFTEQKLLLALQLLVPLAALPIRYRRVLFLLLPGLIVVGLANSDSAITRVHFHYSTHFLPYLFLGAIAALAVRSRERRLPSLSAALLGSAIVSVHFGAFFGDRFKTSFHEVSFDWTAKDAELQAAFQKLAEQIPSEASVSAGEYEGAQLARRSSLSALKAGAGGAEYLIYSRRSLRWGGREEVQRVLAAGEYGVVDMQADMTLLAQGHDTARNQSAMQRLR